MTSCRTPWGAWPLGIYKDSTKWKELNVRQMKMLEQCPVRQRGLKTLRKGVSKWERVGFMYFPSVAGCLPPWKPMSVLPSLCLIGLTYSLTRGQCSWPPGGAFVPQKAIQLSTIKSQPQFSGHLLSLWREQFVMFCF